MPTIEFHKESNVSAVKMNVAIICVEVPWGTADFFSASSQQCGTSYLIS